MNDLERRQARLRRARSAIRVELAVGFAAPIVVAVLVLATSTGFRPMFLGLLYELTPFAGVLGVIFGLVWMVRLSRPNPEPDQHSWRFRDP